MSLYYSFDPLQIWVVIDLVRYCSQICHEICDYLHVELFRIPYPGGPQKTYVQSPSEKNGKTDKKFQSDEEDAVPLLGNTGQLD
nr:unnamed protein product [Callosobruchus analis]